MIVKIKLFLILSAVLGIGFCTEKSTHIYQRMTCDVDYALNEMYYGTDDAVVLNVSFNWFTDTVGGIEESYIDSSMAILNSAFSNANISFEIKYSNEIISDEGTDMPSYVKHARKYNVDDAINIYVYDDEQLNFSDDKTGVVGSAGGIPSTYFAIRKSFLKTVTSAHEMGHVLGLFHVDTPDIDSTGSTSSTGDLVCDTKSAIRLMENVTPNCLYSGPGTYTVEEAKELGCNIMSDASSKCRGCFTEGQIARMKWSIQQSQDLRKTIKSPLIQF